MVILPRISMASEEISSSMKQYFTQSCHSAENEENEMGDLIYAYFCGIFTVDPNLLSYFRMLEYKIPKNIKFGPSHVVPQPP